MVASRDWPGAPNVNYYVWLAAGGGRNAGGAGEGFLINMPNCGYGGNGGAGSTNDYTAIQDQMVTYAGGWEWWLVVKVLDPYGSPGPNGTGGSGGGGQSR